MKNIYRKKVKCQESMQRCCCAKYVLVWDVMCPCVLLEINPSVCDPGSTCTPDSTVPPSTPPPIFARSLSLTHTRCCFALAVPSTSLAGVLYMSGPVRATSLYALITSCGSTASILTTAARASSSALYVANRT